MQWTCILRIINSKCVLILYTMTAVTLTSFMNNTGFIELSLIHACAYETRG
jgi:hypothetical protein